MVFCRVSGMTPLGHPLATDLQFDQYPLKDCRSDLLEILVSVACIVTTLIVLLQSDATTKPCPSCTWLSCVPFPPWESNDNKWWYCDDCGRVTAEFGATLPLHLEMQCPSGGTAIIELEGEADDIDSHQVQKDLPDYCREFCPLAEDDIESTTVPN